MTPRSCFLMELQIMWLFLCPSLSSLCAVLGRESRKVGLQWVPHSLFSDIGLPKNIVN